MPLYEYHCSCGHTTEEFRRVDDRNDPARCACGNAATRHISAVAGFKFGRDGFLVSPGRAGTGKPNAV